MLLEPGGYAEKLGNRYEGRWVVRQVLHLLNEEIRSITVEAIGDDEAGVDLWIERKNGVREAQQCKIGNADSPDWSMAELNQRAILRYLRKQLERDGTYEFALISSVPAITLEALSRSARDSSGDPQAFYLHQVQSRSKKLQTAFADFCRYLDLDPQKSHELATAFSLLKRTDFHLFSDDLKTKDEMKAWAGYQIAGEPITAVAAIADYIEQNLRKPIYADTIRTYLASLGLHPRQLPYDNRIAPAVENLQTQFKSSIGPGLIGGALIPRDETSSILKAVDEQATIGVVLLHGSAGTGKSGVLYELALKLGKRETPFLPIRLDRKFPQNNTIQFGKDIGLPESPVRCLQALADQRPSVLILDQLDALRWTSTHSADALDVCKSLVNEVLTARISGQKMTVVLACRTFDFKRDPGIKEWLHDGTRPKPLEVHLSALKPETVKCVVEAHRANYGRMSSRQRSLLESPQNLAMWVTLQSSDNPNLADFQSAAQLMRLFWKDRYALLAKEGLPSKETQEALEVLARSMESQGRIWAPVRLLDAHPRASTLLHSVGVIQTEDNRLTFCHQSYLDFQIADRVMREINEGNGSVRDWLGSKENQSLFRREQLRLVLSLLFEEEPNRLERTVHELLQGDEIRFHLKHLVLSIIGQIENPSPWLLDFSAELLNEAHWKEHVKDLIYMGHEPFVRSLVEKGIMTRWLNSDEKETIRSALWLFQSVHETCGNMIAEVLEPHLNRGDEWPQWILEALWSKPEKDSERLFKLRLQLARMGFMTAFIDWRTLANKYPLRVIRLVEAVIFAWKVQTATEKEDEGGSKRSRDEDWGEKADEALEEAARQHPQVTWDLLIPQVERLTRAEGMERNYGFHGGEEDGVSAIHQDHPKMSRGVLRMLSEAARALAKHSPEDFLSRAQGLNPSRSPAISKVLINGYSELPPIYADAGIEWLLEDLDRLRVASGHGNTRWVSVRLIKKLSPHCSEAVFYRLEHALVHYHSPEEKELAKYYLEKSREGYYGYWFGEAQYFHLPALAPQRRSDYANSLIRVLKRKFGEGGRFLRRSFDGAVDSPLRTEILHRISDRAWLAIVSNKKIKEDSWPKRRRKGRYVNSSIGNFSSGLRWIAKRQPDRFTRLALRFPLDVNRRYVGVVLDAVKAIKPEDLSEEEKTDWTPASRESIEALLDRFAPGNDVSTALDFAWLIEARADEMWSQSAVDRLVRYAGEHPHPEPQNLSSHSEKTIGQATVSDLEHETLNSVRGVAGGAIGALLRKHPDWFDRLRPGIEHLIQDPHPAVRIASLDACLATLEINKDLAVEWFCRACEDELRVAASRKAVYMFNTAIHTHSALLSPIVRQMLKSRFQEVAREGASEVAARWLFHGMFEQELEECKLASVAHRKGLAQVAAHFLGEMGYFRQCHELLSPLINDVDAEVRAAASAAFRKGKVLDMPDMPSFCRTFVSSQAFEDDPSNFLYAFEGYTGSTLPYAEVILDIVKIFAGPLLEKSRDISTRLAHDVHLLSPLLLRLYDQSRDTGSLEIVAECLDAWDAMFEKRIGVVHELMKDIDR